MTAKHPDYTPYAYVYNNPLRFFDPFGQDSTQRAAAVKKAEEYVKRNPGDSYPTAEDTKNGLYRGQPGEKVDCAGMADNIMVAGGEPSSTDKGKETGVLNLIAQSEKIGSNVEDLSKAQTGNFIVLNNTREEPLDPKRNSAHIATLVELKLDDQGKVVTARIVHSSGTPGSGKSGPNSQYLVKDGQAGYWGKRVTAVLKWDRRPDR
jgi:hypothetical protein